MSLKISQHVAATSVKLADEMLVNITPVGAGATKRCTLAQVSDAFLCRRGQANLSSGITTVTVTGLALPASPSLVPIVSVSRPTGEDLIFGNVVPASVSSDGFTVELSAPLPSANYKLSWII